MSNQKNTDRARVATALDSIEVKVSFWQHPVEDGSAIPDPDTHSIVEQWSVTSNPLSKRVLVNRDGRKAHSNVPAYSPRVSSSERELILKEDTFFRTLPRDVVHHLATDGRHFCNLRQGWLALEDALILSTPEVRRGDPAIEKLHRWYWCTVGFGRDGRGGLRTATTGWKSFVVWIKHRVLRSDTEEPTVQRGFPFFSEKGEWAGIPLESPLSWVNHVISRGFLSKGEGTRVCHLCTTRGLPAPSRSVLDESIVKHRTTLSLDRTFSEERLDTVRRLAVRVGRKARSILESRKGSFHSSGHLSLTSSASVESPVSNGGRQTYVSADFVTWLQKEMDGDDDGTTIIGRRYWTQKHQQRWRTMCRPQIASEGSIGESALISNYEPTERFIFQDPIYGIDRWSGLQLHQWATEQGIANGTLIGPAFFKNAADSEPLKIGRPPMVRVSVIGEPGGKGRTVTAGEAWVTEFLQPFAHHTTGALAALPQARAGLGAAAQMYEYIKGASEKGKDLDSIEDLWFLTSDLATATDFCDHKVSAALLRGFYEGWDWFYQHPYIETCINLLCSPRTVVGNDVWVTSSGVLMGDPGTKAVLTLFNLVAEEEAFVRYSFNVNPEDDIRPFLDQKPPSSVWRHFSCSGDDHAAMGPREYLLGITRAHAENGMSVKWEANFLSKVGCFYCEEMMLSTPHNKFDIGYLPKAPYHTTKHVDALKVRLVSPCVKEVKTGPGDSVDRNPAVGKGLSFLRKLDWLPDGWRSIRDPSIHRFYSRMDRWIPAADCWYQYLPRSLGGIGLPLAGEEISDFRKLFELLPARHQSAIARVLQGTASPSLRQAMSRFASNQDARGVDISNLHIQEEVEAYLCIGNIDENWCATSEFFTEADIFKMSGFNHQRWNNLRWRDKERIAQQCGYISIAQALQEIEKPYTYKFMLLGYFDVQTQFDVRPWTERYKRYINDLQKLQVPEEEIDWNQFSPIGHEELSQLPNPGRDRFIPKSRLESNLCTLKVPIYRWTDSVQIEDLESEI